MDDDTLPRPDALGKLLEADESLNGNYGFLSSVVLWTDGSGCKMNRQKVKKNFYENVGLLTKSLIPVDQATFVSLFIKTETVKKAGLPVKEFFIWGDDLEYTRRMAVRMKMPCYLVGRSQVVHAMRTNNGSCIATDAPERIDRYRYAYRNENFAYRYEGIKGIVKDYPVSGGRSRKCGACVLQGGQFCPEKKGRGRRFPSDEQRQKRVTGYVF